MSCKIYCNQEVWEELLILHQDLPDIVTADLYYKGELKQHDINIMWPSLAAICKWFKQCS